MCVCLASGLAFHAQALAPESDALFVRVIDVGAGLCCVAVIPEGHYIIYDAGNYKDRGALTFRKIAELIPEGSTVDLLVLSHSDADHLGAVDEICDAYNVKRIVHPGHDRPTATWREAKRAIRAEEESGECTVLNLHDAELPVGETETIGEAVLTWVFGLSEPPQDWVDTYRLEDSEQNNVGSIVLKLTYAGTSVLFCGDSVGRHIGDPVDTCIAAEKAMVDNATAVPLGAEYIVAPHHGADNGSSMTFIRAVNPTYVVFSAGHEERFQHPRSTTAQRYLDAGIKVENIFRTDLGDDDGEKEWDYGRVLENEDRPGDDDVDILIRKDEVGYRAPHE